ncbi:MAG TPA: hypothetical protein VEI83_09655 [Acidimicrobiales bacterium]|nr:hypothetical protein [Acidimicrobiales bacterium]
MNDLLRTPVGPPGGDCPSPLDGTLRIAMASLGRCRRSVCALPLFAPAERLLRGLNGLVAWYQRVCEDDCYANAAPSEGLRALSRMSRDPKTSDLPSVIVSTKAVRVAEELVAYRAVMGVGGEPDSSALLGAMEELVVAMRKTRRRLP